MDPGLPLCPVKADPAGQEGGTAACLPGLGALCWEAGARGLGSLCQLVLWQRLSLDFIDLLPFVIEIIEADMLLSMICHPWSLTTLCFDIRGITSNAREHCRPTWLVFNVDSPP